MVACLKRKQWVRDGDLFDMYNQKYSSLKK